MSQSSLPASFATQISSGQWLYGLTNDDVYAHHSRCVNFTVELQACITYLLELMLLDGNT